MIQIGPTAAKRENAALAARVAHPASFLRNPLGAESPGLINNLKALFPAILRSAGFLVRAARRWRATPPDLLEGGVYGGCDQAGADAGAIGSAGDGGARRWRIYLRLAADETGNRPDRRQCRPLAPRLQVEGAPQTQGQLWVHPMPSPPSSAINGGWSEGARKAWLDGADADPVAVFDEVCAAMEEYLDVEELVAGDQLPVAELVASDQVPVASQRPKLATENWQLATSSPHPLIATLSLWVLLTYLYGLGFSVHSDQGEGRGKSLERTSAYPRRLRRPRGWRGFPLHQGLAALEGVLCDFFESGFERNGRNGCAGIIRRIWSILAS